MAELLAGRSWPFSSEAAHWYGELLCRRELLARPTATADAVIAAMALAHGVPLATRDVADFADIGMELINPWVGHDHPPRQSRQTLIEFAIPLTLLQQAGGE